MYLMIEKSGGTCRVRWARTSFFCHFVGAKREVTNCTKILGGQSIRGLALRSLQGQATALVLS